MEVRLTLTPNPFINETNFSQAMKPEKVPEALGLNRIKDTIWYVVPSCATTGEGLLEGLVRPLPFSFPKLR
jgi:hypothetical protein